jgi:hypothetical protein
MAGFPNQTFKEKGWPLLPGWLDFQTKPYKKGLTSFTWLSGFPNQTL